jgi:hypothetical protein
MKHIHRGLRSLGSLMGETSFEGLEAFKGVDPKRSVSPTFFIREFRVGATENVTFKGFLK